MEKKFRNNLFKINFIIFILYLVNLALNHFWPNVVFLSLKTILGIAIFFLTGLNCAQTIKEKIKLKLDLVETTLIGFFISLFFIPLFIFLLYKAIGNINEWLNFFVYFAISLISLLILKYQKER